MVKGTYLRVGAFSLGGKSYGSNKTDSLTYVQLIYDVYEQINVRGKVVCNPEIKKHYGIAK